jgi:hypothetical protein
MIMWAVAGVGEINNAYKILVKSVANWNIEKEEGQDNIKLYIKNMGHYDGKR